MQILPVGASQLGSLTFPSVLDVIPDVLPDRRILVGVVAIKVTCISASTLL